MLAKKNRLAKEANFKKIAQKGRPFYSQNLTIKTLKTDDPEPIFGVVISAKVSKKAVERNRLRRQIMEIIRLKMDRLRPGFKVMILVKKSLLDKSYQAMEIELDYLFKKSALYKKE